MMDEAKEILEEYGSLEAYFEAQKEDRKARRKQILGMSDLREYRHEALTSLAIAETAAGVLDTEQEAMYYVALAQVFATLELVETLQRKD
jgi:hypothetical protein